jgi:hypothetical protein
MTSESQNKFSLRVIETEKGRLVNICDVELLGREFREKGIVLSIKEEFYKGITVDEDVVIDEMKKADILIVIGKRAVDIAIREKIIHPFAVLEVEGVPYAMYTNVL